MRILEFAASYSKRPIVCKSIIQHVVGTDEKCKFVNSDDKEQTENGTVVWNHANAGGFQFEKTLFSISYKQTLILAFKNDNRCSFVRSQCSAGHLVNIQKSTGMVGLYLHIRLGLIWAKLSDQKNSATTFAFLNGDYKNAFIIFPTP